MAFWRKNKFQQDEIVIALKDKKGKGFNTGYVTIGNRVYKITTSANVQKAGVAEWCTVTKTDFKADSGMASARY